MRAMLLALAILAAGCVSSPAATTPTVNNSTAPTHPANASAAVPVPAIGERMPVSNERIILLANHTLDALRPGMAVPTTTNVPDDLPPTAFYQGAASTPAIKPWASFVLQNAFEITSDLDITVSLMASANAASVIPSQTLPPVGGWFGTVDRRAIFMSPQGAPTTLDAGKTYTLKMHVTPPKGGFFLHAGEQLAIYIYETYQTADNSPVNWVVGGPELGGFALPHTHFNLTAPRATTVLDKSADLGPCPSVTSTQDQQPVDLAFKVPADAAYVVAHMVATPKGGPHIDADLSLRTGAGQEVGGASGPQAEETVTLGPGNLAAGGHDLVAHVACSGAPAGGTFALTITSYGPA